MLKAIEVLCHSSIKLNKEQIIYFDPFKINKNYHDADIIFITHDHYDHYSEEDIDKVEKTGTVIVAPEGLLAKLLRKGFQKENIITVKPNESYDVAFVPVGGTYTMNYKEAAELINIIQPKVAVPIHYGSIVGTEQDATNFSKLVSPEILVKILIK